MATELICRQGGKAGACVSHPSMALSIRSVTDLNRLIGDLEAVVKDLKIRSADWSRTGPPNVWLHFESSQVALDSLRKLAAVIPSELSVQAKKLEDGMTLEDIKAQRQGSWGKKKRASNEGEREKFS